jgi:cell division protein FtsI (penicillin-binding protein 3)
MADPRGLRDLGALHDRQLRRIRRVGTAAGALVCALLVLVLGRVAHLQVSPDPRLARVVGVPFSRTPEIPRRGSLVDRRGRPLALSTIGQRLFIDPALVEDLRTIALDVTALIGGDPTEIDKRLQARPASRYIVVRDLLEDWQADAIRGARLRGVGLEPRPVRHHTAGAVAARLVGRVGVDQTGLSLLEHRFDDTMQGTPGGMTYLRDVRGRPLWVEPDQYQPSRPGDVVRLSIDLAIQAEAERRLEEEVERVNAGGGRIVVMDAATGELLALHDVLRSRRGAEDFAPDPQRDLDPSLGRNRCATDPYEPGSTFKPFVWATALELGRVTLDQHLDTPASGVHRTPYGRVVRDVHAAESSTLREVLVHSQNSGMAIIAEHMTHRDMQSVMRRFGFGERTACGLPGESSGIVTGPRDWSKYTQTSVAMGYEVGVTALQMVRAFSAFCRDGTMAAPRLTTAGDFTVIARAIEPATVRATREALRDVIESPSRKAIQSTRYVMFGKSGTAMLTRKEGGYHDDRYISSFIAGAPFADPRIVVLCVIDDPDRAVAHFGTAVAGPVVRDIADFTLEYLGVPPDRPPANDAIADSSR